MTVSLDLGSGPVPKNPYGADEVWGVDITPFPDVDNVKQWDAVMDAIPFETSSVDYVVCTDFLEHVPRIVYLWSEAARQTYNVNPFIQVMSEVWRVLKPGGQFLAKTPAFPRAEAFQDPTHVNIITENTWDYFAGGLVGLCQQYGFKGQFSLNAQYWEGFWLVWDMTAVKDE